MDFQTWRIIFSDIGEPISVKKLKMILRVVPDFPIDGYIYAYMHTHINTNHTCTHTRTHIHTHMHTHTTDGAKYFQMYIQIF